MKHPSLSNVYKIENNTQFLKLSCNYFKHIDCWNYKKVKEGMWKYSFGGKQRQPTSSRSEEQESWSSSDVSRISMCYGNHKAGFNLIAKNQIRHLYKHSLENVFLNKQTRQKTNKQPHGSQNPAVNMAMRPDCCGGDSPCEWNKGVRNHDKKAWTSEGNWWGGKWLEDLFRICSTPSKFNKSYFVQRQ